MFGNGGRVRVRYRQTRHVVVIYRYLVFSRNTIVPSTVGHMLDTHRATVVINSIGHAMNGHGLRCVPRGITIGVRERQRYGGGSVPRPDSHFGDFRIKARDVHSYIPRRFGVQLYGVRPGVGGRTSFSTSFCDIHRFFDKSKTLGIIVLYRHRHAYWHNFAVATGTGGRRIKCDSGRPAVTGVVYVVRCGVYLHLLITVPVAGGERHRRTTSSSSGSKGNGFVWRSSYLYFHVGVGRR